MPGYLIYDICLTLAMVRIFYHCLFFIVIIILFFVIFFCRRGFVGKSYKAKGKRITTYAVESINELPPVRFPDESSSAEEDNEKENDDDNNSKNIFFMD